MGPGLVNRDNPVFIKIAADNRTGKIPGLISLAKDAGDLVVLTTV
ncbi:pyruvate/2-oxoglutarate dehydrogenase complex dihydrolipoamide dehydrogenase (E3) component [Arthrobacter bambusae]|nr:pyruvate/2-oxoglutarate dehydrogenase complex dihydrolipoamide dehydrogenase (E3) component [Arthrobacter bambusae]MDQ0237721.1 pyruvate/2-oxoglutarate dehydrogenase complex dihydrolipoamide dehydrogenase (E3) component [Arthrobacter bambusae]